MSTGWGASFLDADFDSNLDLYVSGSLDGSVGGFLSAAFYHNDGDDTFTIPNNIGFENDTRHSYGNAIGDLNNDGKPDIVVMNNNDNYFLWENQTATSDNWIKVKLEGVTSNRDGIGNKIEVHANGKSQYRYTVCGEGYLGQNSHYEFVGVGGATNIDYIKVTWNKTGIVETINNVQPNQAVRIQEGNGILNAQSEDLLNFLVYPNPSNNGVYNINSHDDEIKVTVFDLSGRQVYSNSIVNESLDISKLSSGIYVAKFFSGTKSKTVKLMRN